MSDQTIQWRDVSPNFGTAHEFGCCNAVVGSRIGGVICGWPRLSDGTCRKGHPAQPGWIPPSPAEVTG